MRPARQAFTDRGPLTPAPERDAPGDGNRIRPSVPEGKNNMADDLGSDGPDEILVCVWCGSGVLSTEVRRGKQPVCSKCVRLLLDANLSDEEIFGGKETHGGDDPRED